MEVMEKQVQMATVHSKWEISVKEIFPQFECDKENESVVKMLKLYLARDARFETLFPQKNYSLNKGIVLLGGYGTGKTKMMQIFQRAGLLLRLDIQFQRFDMRKLCAKYQSEGGEILLPGNKNWFVDEFGLVKDDDPREFVNSYGNKVILGDELIGVRYDLFQQGYLTNLTTNLTVDEIQQYYSPRTWSRLQEMCNFIPLDGRDRRTTAKPVRPVETVVAKEIDKKKIARDWWQMIKRDHAAYKLGAQLLFIGGLRQFLQFEEAGLINISTKEKLAYIQKAKDLILGKKKEELEQKEKERKKLVSTDLLQFKKILVLRKAIENGVLKPEQENEIKALAAGIAIQDFYDGKTQDEFNQLVDRIIGKI